MHTGKLHLLLNRAEIVEPADAEAESISVITFLYFSPIQNFGKRKNY